MCESSLLFGYMSQHRAISFLCDTDACQARLQRELEVLIQMKRNKLLIPRKSTQTDP